MPEEPAGVAQDVLDTLLANHRRFLAFLVGRVGSREDAEEILQSAFVRGIEKVSTLRDAEHSVAWFFRLLRNAVVDHQRRKAARARSLEAAARQMPEFGADFEAELERTVCGCVHDLVPLLKPEYADLIRRVDLAGGDPTTTAAALGITPGNVRVRLHRARTALRKELERSCRTCADHGCLDCTCSSASSLSD